MGRADRTTSELTSEVFAAAFEASARYRRNGTPARAWLFGIADHKLADAARRRHIDDRAQRRLGIERLELPDQELERVEELADLERAGGRLEALVDDLPPAEREAVLARVVRAGRHPARTLPARRDGRGGPASRPAVTATPHRSGLADLHQRRWRPLPRRGPAVD